MDKYPVFKTQHDVISGLNRISQLRNTDVIQFNQLQQANGYSSGFSRTTKTITASYSAGLNDLSIDADATGGAITVTLAASPIDGQQHEISKNDASANAVTISGNGKNINGSGTLVIAAQYGFKRVRFYGGTGEWRVC